MTDKEFLVQSLIKDRYLKTPRLIEAFEKIDRKDFILPETMGETYGNYPLSIGHGQTISQPLTVAFMLELFEPHAGEKILDVGAGSGWTSALLAYCVSRAARINADSTQNNAEKIPSNAARLNAKKIPRSSASVQRTSAGCVIAIERIQELCKFGEVNVRKYNFVEKGIVKFHCGDGYRGAPKEFLPVGGFDKILASAAIENQLQSASYPRSSVLELIPKEWKNQLKIGGRIVAPVGQSIVVLDKISGKGVSAKGGPASGWKEKEYFGFSFVPLVSDK